MKPSGMQAHIGGEVPYRRHEYCHDNTININHDFQVPIFVNYMSSSQ
jgi:hypothetical protein